MNKVFDCIVIGGGPAGSFCAAKLASQGLSCIILEKREKMTGKVCGDGVSRYGVRILQKYGISLETLLSAGGVKVNQYLYFKNGYEEKVQLTCTDSLADYAVGISRDSLDELFIKHAVDCGSAVCLGTEVCDIRKYEGLFEVCGYLGKSVVVASGANSNWLIDKITNTHFLPQRPAGVSSIIEAEATSKDKFFLFDYDEIFKGGYGWAIPISATKWNVGVWSNLRNIDLKNLFSYFVENRLEKIFDKKLIYIRNPKGALMGVGKKIESIVKGLYLVGDAANSADVLSGEGISHAIITGEEAANRIIFGVDCSG